MNEEKRLVELMAEMLIKQDEMVQELRNVNKEVSGVKNEVSGVKREVMKLNLQTAENTRAIMKLADHAEMTAQFESRISNLEKVVYK